MESELLLSKFFTHVPQKSIRNGVTKDINDNIESMEVGRMMTDAGNESRESAPVSLKEELLLL